MRTPFEWKNLSCADAAVGKQPMRKSRTHARTLRIYSPNVPARQPPAAVLFRRHEAFQLLVPMLHDDERGRRGARVAPGRFDHQEALTVERHVVRAARAGAGIVASLEELHWRAGVPGSAARLNRHAEQRPVGTEIEQFLAAPCPERLLPPSRRDLPLAAADVRKGPDVDVERARTIGLVRQ